MIEKVRAVSRTYKPAKADVKAVESGLKPAKPFVNRKDFKFWKQVIKKTDLCVKKGGTEKVSVIYSVANGSCRYASKLITCISGKSTPLKYMLNSTRMTLLHHTVWQKKESYDILNYKVSHHYVEIEIWEKLQI